MTDKPTLQQNHPREIPLIDLRETSPGAAARAYADSVNGLLVAGKKMMTPFLIGLMDRRSERWARRIGNPYADEVEEVAASFSRGIWFMNFCYEWGCTTGVAEDGSGGVTMRRTLDWPFNGLGQELAVLHQAGPAGEFYNIGWPGFVGVVTGMAPGRFAIAINQAPIRSRGPWPVAIDWLLERIEVGGRSALPPVHLARKVLEECPDFESAAEMIQKTETALPAFFSIAGTKPGDGCVIEHLSDQAHRHPMPTAVANDWLSDGLSGKPRGKENVGRRRQMISFGEKVAAEKVNGSVFDWLQEPVLNRDTRLAAVMNASRGSLALRGYEKTGPATQDFIL